MDTSDTVASSVFEDFRKNDSGRFVVVEAIERLLKTTRAGHIILSYSSGGRATAEELNDVITSVTEYQESVKASLSPQGIKFWKCVAGLSVLLTVGDHGMKLTEGVLKLLQPPHNTVIEVQIDSASKSSLSPALPHPGLLPTEKKNRSPSP